MSGYAIFPDVITPKECEGLTRLSTGRAGTRHLMDRPEVASIVQDERMLRIARSMIGSEAVPFKATLFEKSARANWVLAWHQDRSLPFERPFQCEGWGPWSRKEGVAYAQAPASALTKVVALRLHLDVSGPENGPLRVVPGSHETGVLSDLQVLAYAHTHECVECLSPAGGVIAMRPLLIHASSKNASGQPRRVLHIEYATSLDVAPGARLKVV